MSVLVLIALAVIIVDPFVHYHAPFFGLAAAETDERGQQIGVAKNLDYDTAIVGSSMSENFEAGWFDDGIIGNSTVNLSMQGAHFADYSRLLNVVLSKPETKTVIISLDNYLILHNPEEYPTTIPDYLENDTLTDDIYYLWKNNQNELTLNNLYLLGNKYNVIPYIFYMLYYTNLLYSDPLLQVYINTLKTPEGEYLLDYYGLSDEERKPWRIDFLTRLNSTNLPAIIYPDTSSCTDPVCVYADLIFRRAFSA